MSKLLSVVPWLVGLAVGAALGWFFMPQPRVRLVDTLPAAVKLPATAAENSLSEADARALAADIAARLESGTGYPTIDAWQRIEAMTPAQLSDFIRALDSHPPLSDDERQVLNLACERWATLDPPGFLRWLERGSRFANHPQFRDRWFQLGLLALVATDPGAAVRVACDLSSPGRIQAALRSIAESLAATDPQLLLDLPKRSGLQGAMLRNLQLSVARALAARDPEAAADYCLKSARHSAEDIIELWVASDPAAAIAWIESNHADDNELHAWRNAALRQLARADPKAGLALLESLPSALKLKAIPRFADYWAKVDSAAAVEWALSLSNKAAKMAALEELSDELAESDPELAEALIDAIPNAAARAKQFTRYAELRVLNMRAPEPHLEWAKSQTDPKRRSVALDAVVGQWAESSPESAADYAFAAESPAEKETLATIVARNVQIEGSTAQQLTRLRAWSSDLAPADRALALRKTLEVHRDRIPAPVRKALESGVSVDAAIDMTERLLGENQ